MDYYLDIELGELEYAALCEYNASAEAVKA